jgi:hypothetical protein
VQFGHTLCIKALASLKGDVNQVVPNNEAAVPLEKQINLKI